MTASRAVPWDGAIIAALFRWPRGEEPSAEEGIASGHIPWLAYIDDGHGA
ncbi:hypothetical protein ACQKGL_16920 [Ensifer adhaerens]